MCCSVCQTRLLWYDVNGMGWDGVTQITRNASMRQPKKRNEINIKHIVRKYPDNDFKLLANYSFTARCTLTANLLIQIYLCRRSNLHHHPLPRPVPRSLLSAHLMAYRHTHYTHFDSIRFHLPEAMFEHNFV